MEDRELHINEIWITGLESILLQSQTTVIVFITQLIIGEVQLQDNGQAAYI